MTKFIKKEDINSKWFDIDAKDAVVGRLATIVSKIIEIAKLNQKNIVRN